MPVAIGLWVACTAVCAVGAITRPHSHTVYPIYTYAARAWQQGEDLYVCVPEFDFYRYCPTFAALTSLLLPLGEGWGGAAWRVLGVVTLAAGLHRWCRVIAAGDSPALRGLVFLLIVPFMIQNVHNGQVNVLILGALLLGTADAQEDRLARSAGWFAAAILIKPYLIAVAGLVILTRPRLAPRLGLALVAGLAVSFLFQKPGYVIETHLDWLHHLTGNDRSTASIREQYRDLGIVIRMYIGPIPPVAVLAISAVAGIGLAALTCVRKLDLQTAFDLGCCWATLFGPATESCTYLLLAPTAIDRVLSQPGAAGFWPRLSYSLLVGATCAAFFPNGWQVQAAGPQPIAAAILLAHLVAGACRRPVGRAVPIRRAA
ncbi:MAG: DUF2029 domain-containing protein [Gemmataceae bacterium]|nr:DUF2029 domain-containing protein [Gemmataceae bacterium]